MRHSFATHLLDSGYDGGFADVYVNGIKLVNGLDVDITSGTDFVLTSGASAGDDVDFIAYGSFLLADTYTKAEIDDKDLNATPRTSTTGSTVLPNGTSVERDVTPLAGYIRWNTTLNSAEIFDGTYWGPVGGGATGGANDDIFYENSQIVTADYTITSGKNAMSAGDIIIDDGVTVTIPDGSNWVIV